MPEVEYSTTAKLPVETIWGFVKDMDNWAHFLTGYQSHEKQSETDSIWVLKGDVGVLSRVLKFQVHVSEWNGPSRVVFQLKGINELMEGGGCFEMEPYEDASSVSESTAERAKPGEGLLARVLAAISRFFFRLIHGRVERAASADKGPGHGMSRLTFKLRIDPGGPMAPMVSAMMKPAMQPVGEDLANKIMAHLESRAQ